MAATRSDMNLLSGDSGFVGRVRAAMIAAAINISSEGWNVIWHKQRSAFAAQILLAPDTYKNLFASSVATDSSVIADATVGGTVALTSGNVATQAALVTDAHIDTAIGGQWNAFLTLP